MSAYAEIESDDWRILQQLTTDGRKTWSDLAQAIGLAARQVR
jgi:DNA-binding Lrp family transcriptional regulator